MLYIYINTVAVQISVGGGGKWEGYFFIMGGGGKQLAGARGSEWLEMETVSSPSVDDIRCIEDAIRVHKMRICLPSHLCFFRNLVLGIPSPFIYS
jgi:hypothetical protein